MFFSLFSIFLIYSFSPFFIYSFLSISFITRLPPFLLSPLLSHLKKENRNEKKGLEKRRNREKIERKGQKGEKKKREEGT